MRRVIPTGYLGEFSWGVEQPAGKKKCQQRAPWEGTELWREKKQWSRLSSQEEEEGKHGLREKKQ